MGAFCGGGSGVRDILREDVKVNEVRFLQPVIPTERLILRPLEKPDAGLIALYAGDARVARTTRDIPNPMPPGAVEAMIERATAEDRGEAVWALDGQASGLSEVIGLVGLERMDRQQSEIWCWVAPAFWNNGFASEAVRALISRNPNNDSRFFAAVFQDDERSARVLINLGFEYLGDAEAFSVARNATCPTWTYTIKL